MIWAGKKRLSCGVVIVNHQAELLLCHVTGNAHWDLPKGGIQTGESPMQAALRETEEECGLVLSATQLLDLGPMAYRSNKSLHLFAALLPRLDTRTLHCDSYFTDLRSGQRRPEMDGFGWFEYHRVPSLCAPRMAVVLHQRLRLDSLLPRLLILQGSLATTPTQQDAAVSA